MNASDCFTFPANAVGNIVKLTIEGYWQTQVSRRNVS